MLQRSMFFVQLLIIVVGCLLFGSSNAHLIAQPMTTGTEPIETLKNPRNQGQYIVIVPPQFQTAIRDFVQWRSAKGYQMRVVTTEDIYREFTDSENRTQKDAIQAFLSYALQIWQRPPQFVLLVGATNLVPSYRIRVTDPLFTPYLSKEDSIPVDEWYVVNRYISAIDTRPKAAIGRFPARDTFQLRNIFNKIRNFEDNGRYMYANYPANFVTINDADDYQMFEDASVSFFSFLRALTRRTYNVRTVDYQRIVNDPIARFIALDAINSGAVFLNYFGHGAPDFWSERRIFTTGDADTSIAPNAKPFILTTVGCSQNFDIPGRPSIVERLMVRPNNGAVMSYASSGLSNLPENSYLITFVYRNLFLATTGTMTVGKAIVDAKNEIYLHNAPQDYIYRRTTLLGDPAMTLDRRMIVSVARATTEAFELRAFPNPCIHETTLSFSLPTAGNVVLEIVSLLGQPLLRREEFLSAGTHTVPISLVNAPAGAYLCRLQHNGQTGMSILSITK